MLFDVPGLNLGAPKTETAQKTGKKVAHDNIPKNMTPSNSDKKSAEILHKSKPKNKNGKDTTAEWLTKSPEVSSNSAPSKTLPPKKIEKNSSKSKLQQKMEEKLRGARFRYLNQKLYQSHSHEALNHFKEHPEDFQNVRFPRKFSFLN